MLKNVSRNHQKWHKVGRQVRFGVSVGLMATGIIALLPLNVGSLPRKPLPNPKFDPFQFPYPRNRIPKGSTPRVSARDDFSSGVATDSSGNVLITGSTNGNLGGTNTGGNDAWVAKYSPNGTLLKIVQLGSPRDDASYGVAIDSYGNVAISGQTAGNLDGTNKGGQDAWAAKYSSRGDLLGIKQLGTPSDDVSYGVAIDSSGNMLISGSTSGSLGGTNRGSTDAWVAKYSPRGALLWVKQLAGTFSDASYAVTTDSSGNVLMSGYTEGSLGGTNRGDTDAWVAKYNPNGTLLWTKQLGSK